jgi:hypothetical protein
MDKMVVSIGKKAKEEKHDFQNSGVLSLDYCNFSLDC